ncbi:methylmalonyl-CoA epimerase [Gordonia humi]|uniref:Methylmalonyl-CoA/ethylmalonyl-CoA epimerase n=1 Tax=Gordonia humi TaxID=686429 RepID=A0A840EZQ7_9ACTN|nr:methylmalonyl-CoA epimerase [Gordonia humi]MBB4135834.1 methylmalonyl-CoA/ethylmalonyl-CoA epimerase [Gordonia humi]
MTNSASEHVNNTTSSGALAAAADLVVGVDHVGIAVADLDATAAWYRDNFGFENLHEEINEEQGVREAMIGPAGGTGALIQLLAPLNEQSTIAKFIDRNGPGLQQLAVRVTDVDAVMARLTDAGIRLLYPAPKRGTADSRINFVHPKDAGGVLLELVEPAAEH